MSRNFKILHSQVGPLPKGRIVSEEDLRDLKADPERLLSLKAIEETKDSISTEPLEVGPENNGLKDVVTVPPEPEPEIPAGSAHHEVPAAGLRIPRPVRR